VKVVQTFEEAEFPNPHAISARLLHAGEHAQFEHLMMAPGQVQKRHAAFTTVHLFVLEGEGELEAGDERLHIHADMLIVMPSETMHRLTNSGAARLRVLNIKAPPPSQGPRILKD